MKLGPRLPDRDKKSIESIQERLIHDPRRPVAALIMLDAPRTEHNNFTGSEEVLARIRLLAPLHPSDLQNVEAMLRRAMQARENQLELPLDVRDELDMIMEELFGDDPGNVDEDAETPEEASDSEGAE